MAIISYALGVEKYALVALCLQWGVYLVHGLPNNSEKFYDASGSLTHLSLILLSAISHPIRHPRQVVNSVLCVIWLVRLGTFLFNRILKDGRDTRFDDMKKVPIRFLGVWTLQALWVFLVDLPVVIINNKVLDEASAGSSLQWCDYLGWALWAVGFLCEAIADAQKMVFRADPANHDKFITTGLWAYSRHPNYFGEILMWCAMCLTCSSMWQGAEYLGLLSPAFTTLLLMKVSGVPMLEAAGKKKWGTDPAYQHYMSRTSCILPMAPAPPLKSD